MPLSSLYILRCLCLAPKVLRTATLVRYPQNSPLEFLSSFVHKAKHHLVLLASYIAFLKLNALAYYTNSFITPFIISVIKREKHFHMSCHDRLEKLPRHGTML